MFPGGPAGGVAIELALSVKTLADYERILRWYGAALDYRQIRWFCATATIQKRIAGTRHCATAMWRWVNER
jgi:hypothetical protein